jgi:hypothetical protein
MKIQLIIFPIKNTRDESMKLYFNGLKINNGKICYKDDGLPELFLT